MAPKRPRDVRGGLQSSNAPKRTRDEGGDVETRARFRQSLLYRGINSKVADCLIKLGITRHKDLDPVTFDPMMRKNKKVWGKIISPSDFIKINRAYWDIEKQNLTPDMRSLFKCGKDEGIVICGKMIHLNKIGNQIRRIPTCWCFATGDCTAICYACHQKEEFVIDASKQELLDNVRPNEKNAYGARMDEAFEYIKKDGICRERDYNFPYQYNGKKGAPKPKTKEQKERAIKIVDFEVVEKNEEQTLREVVAKHPVVVMIRVTKDFKNLKEEIYEGSTTGIYKKVKHAVILVGYCYELSTNKLLYWIVRNSYGESWGIRGYGKMTQRDAKGKLIMHTAMATYPIFVPTNSG